MSDPRTKALTEAILQGDCAEALSSSKQLYDSGISPEYIVTYGIEAAMSALDSKCTLEHFNLLEIMLAGRAVMEVMKFLYPAGTPQVGRKGTVVLATLEGDVHDLGKGIFKTILLANGYRVVDCGKDCPLRKLIEVAERELPFAIGISGLITSIIPLVKQVKGLLILQDLDRVQVVAGGAALKQSSPDKLNVDFVAQSAFDGLHYLDRILETGNE
jgi:methanogenic corrinoid protein MtbC1